MRFEQPAWSKHLPADAVVNIATLGPVGTNLRAPGTWGSLAGIIFFLVCCTPLSDFEIIVAAALLGYFAVGICGEAEIKIGRKDPGEVILDEVVAIPLCFFGWRMIAGGSGFWAFVALVVAAFALFRFYDIRKPWVINRLQELPGGWGVVVDDTAAALATCATLHVAHAIWALTFGHASA